MPLYEITVITRPLTKLDLVTVLKRTGQILLNSGAVIASLQSLGYRDLPFRRFTHTTKEHVFTSNMFLYNAYAPIGTIGRLKDSIRKDIDLVHVGFVNDKEHEAVPRSCSLENTLTTPAYRETVAALRAMQKMNHYTRQRIYKRAEKEWKAIPKSYPVAASID
uniref:Small ribosomal subunit protein bS6m n=1 Tax=Ditylenchus dipsaci TaxID=166011 RepID=A0A915EHT2_9BILA